MGILKNSLWKIVISIFAVPGAAILSLSFIFSAVVCHADNAPALRVTHYEYGKIIINGEEYTKDLAIWPDGQIQPGPEDMHFLSVNDFKELFNSGLKKIVIGTGDEGKVAVDFRNKLKEEFKTRNIELIMINTHDLVDFLNNNQERDFLVLVHLKC